MDEDSAQERGLAGRVGVLQVVIGFVVLAAPLASGLATNYKNTVK